MTREDLTPKPSRPPRCGYGATTGKEAEGIQGIHVVVNGMKPPAPVPCVECPTRRTATPGYLGGYTVEMFLSMLHSRVSVACHMTKGFKAGDPSTQHHCRGACAYRANVGVRTGTAADTAISLVGPDRETFFATPEEFYLHHKPGQVEADDGRLP